MGEGLTHVFTCTFVSSRKICLGDTRRDTWCFEGGSPSVGYAGAFIGGRKGDLCSGGDAG